MLTPIAKRILVKPIETKKGTLLITNQKPTQYTVIAIGDEVTKVKVGNTIYLEKHHGAEIEHENEKYLVIEEGSILAKIKEDRPIDDLQFDTEKIMFTGITEYDLVIWKEYYPRLDIPTEISKCADMIKSVSGKPEERNWRKFLITWFEKKSLKSAP